MQQAPPRRRPKEPSRRTRIVLASILGACLLAIALALVGAVVGHDEPSTPGGPVATVNPSEAVPGRDAGAGTPGAPCSTDRLGKFFVKDGVTYTCGGPKPYHWLPPA